MIRDRMLGSSLQPGCACALVVLLAWCAAGAAGEDDGPAPRDRLVLVDGTTVAGTIASIGRDGTIALDGLEQRYALDGLRRIERVAGGATGTDDDAEAVLELAEGGRLLAQRLAIGDEACQLAWPHGRLSVPLDAVRAIRFRPGQTRPDFQAAFATAEPFDRLFAENGGQVVAIRGFIEELDDERLMIEWDGAPREVPRAKLFGIVLASIDATRNQRAPCRVDLACGSRLEGAIVSLTGGESATLAFRPSWEAELAIPWEGVARVSIRSDRLVYLSDLAPVEVEEASIVAFPRRWQADLSVRGRPLTLGTRTFAKGIGMQARSRLAFGIDGRFDLLCATIGIDAGTGGHGDCVFVVLGDGQQRFRKRVKGTDPPCDLRVDVRGVTELVLLVEPGEDLDLGDHADWCDACLIRPANGTTEEGGGEG